MSADMTVLPDDLIDDIFATLDQVGCQFAGCAATSPEPSADPVTCVRCATLARLREALDGVGWEQ